MSRTSGDPLEQRHRLIRQQLTARDLESLAQPVPAVGPEVQHLAAVSDSGLAQRQRRPVAGTRAQAPSGAQPRRRTIFIGSAFRHAPIKIDRYKETFHQMPQSMKCITASRVSIIYGTSRNSCHNQDSLNQLDLRQS